MGGGLEGSPTVLGMGKHSLSCGKARAGLKVLCPETRLGPWGCQTLGHLGTTGSHRKAENRIGLKVPSSPAWVGLGRVFGGGPASLSGIDLGLSVASGLVVVVTESTERPSMKRVSSWFQTVYCHGEKLMLKTMSTSQGGPEITFL